ncbi:MAG TPA: aquaporin [Gemmatimonadaceae bacterium]|jgi:MIP family channel proteins|nr:aquaporin [Gemmatimonadaceae bacterium]
MKDTLRPIVAEFIGTFALVFVGGATIINGYVAHSPAPLIDVAVAEGLIYALLVTATMRFSGHLNPAVTVGVAVARRMAWNMAAACIIAQLVGAVVATHVLKAVYPADMAAAARYGGQWVAPWVSLPVAITFEALATFFLVFVFFATIVDAKGPKVAGFGVGLMVAAGIMAAGPVTGGSMNPARSFGPALVSGIWEGHLIYWIGPLVGGIIAALVYDRVFLRSQPAS